MSAHHLQKSASARSVRSSDTSLPNIWQDTSLDQAVQQEERDGTCGFSDSRADHINLLCQIIANRPDIVYSFMKKTRLYKEIEQKSPGLLSEVLSPSRLKMLSNPEMVHSLIRMDRAVQRLIKKSHSKK